MERSSRWNVFAKKLYLSRYFLFLAFPGIPGNFCTICPHLLTSGRLLTVEHVLPRKNAKDLKDGGRFPTRLSIQNARW